MMNMKMIFKLISSAKPLVSLLLLVLLLAVGASPAWGHPPPKNPSTKDGPTLDLPKDEEDGADQTKDTSKEPADLTRGMQAARLRAAAAQTTIGGYAEMHFTRAMPESGDTNTQLDFHRLVLFVAHRFSDKVQFYTELEVEHAFSGEGKPGQIGLEQAFVDYKIAGDKLAVRTGIVLVPMGIINQWHEPPVFNGVERPAVDKNIIPSTWREGGIGLVGSPAPGLNFELYLVGGLNASKFSAGGGVRGGRQAVAKSRADGLALTGRLEYEPELGWVIGGSFYAGISGSNAAPFLDAAGDDLNLDVPVVGGSLDMRRRYKGIEARAVIAGFAIGDTRQLRGAVDGAGDPSGADVGSKILGGYAELGYDVLRLTGTRTDQLVPFARFERYDTMYRVDGRARTDADDARGVTDLVFGMTYRPVPQLAFKGDVILRRPDGASGTTLLSLGFGTMF